MKLTNKALPVLFIAYCICNIHSAHASSIMAQSVESLAKSSEDIITGQVVEQRSEWRNGYISTVSTIRVQKNVKGKTLEDDNLEVRQAGGTVGDTTQKVAGVVLLRPQESLLLFLEKSKNANSRKINSFAQGMYRLQRMNGETMAIPRQPSDLERYKKNTKGKFVISHKREAVVPLDELIDRIEAAQ